MMKPKPFFESNHLTLPVGITVLPHKKATARIRRAETREMIRDGLSRDGVRCTLPLRPVRHPSSPDVIAHGAQKPQAKRVAGSSISRILRPANNFREFA